MLAILASTMSEFNTAVEKLKSPGYERPDHGPARQAGGYLMTAIQLCDGFWRRKT